MSAYYNESDPFSAAWLRELIAQGLIAPGEVDERSIEDVTPNDVAGFTQCHFFAGIGIWSAALRAAGVSDSFPVWTGSCPCQPFSAAGKGAGFADERHLWPAFHHLIRICRPAIVFGEQVASKDGLAWLDLVQADMEGEDYAFGAVDTCAAGFGVDYTETEIGAATIGWIERAIRDCPDPELASGLRDFADAVGGKISVGNPHIRQRLYWVANASGAGLERRDVRALGQQCQTVERGGGAERLANANSDECEGRGVRIQPGRSQQDRAAIAGGSRAERLADANRQQHDRGRGAGERWRLKHPNGSRTGGLADADGGNTSAERQQRSGQQRFHAEDKLPMWRGREGREHRADAELERPGPVNGLWRDADWLFCRDGKWRPVEAGTFPLADAGRYRNRLGALRGSGNALNLAQAQGFIEAIIETIWPAIDAEAREVAA